MEVSDNWKKMYKRIYTEQPALRELLAQIPNDAIRELSTSGSLLAVSGETVARRAAGKERAEQFKLAGEVGRYLIEFEPAEGFGNYTMQVSMADAFPNCAVVALGAIMENFNGKFKKKMKLSISYSTAAGRGDPFGSLLPLAQKCFDFVEFETEAKTVGSVREPHRRSFIDKFFG